MLDLNSEKFLRLMAQMNELSGLLLPSDKVETTFVIDQIVRDDAKQITELLEEMGLTYSMVEGKRLERFFDSKEIQGAEGNRHIRTLHSRIIDELQTRRLLVLSAEESSYYSKTFQNRSIRGRCFSKIPGRRAGYRGSVQVLGGRTQHRKRIPCCQEP